jgi:hypothetical protein
MTTALSNSKTFPQQDPPKYDIFTCLTLYFSARQSGDEFLIRTWERHLTWLRDMQVLGDPEGGKTDTVRERG